MLCVRLSDKYGYLVASSCRSSRLKYMSILYRYIYTLFMTPFYLTGLSSEKQFIQLEMFTDFEDDQVTVVIIDLWKIPTEFNSQLFLNFIDIIFTF